jgi:hypothetical protein
VLAGALVTTSLLALSFAKGLAGLDYRTGHADVTFTSWGMAERLYVSGDSQRTTIQVTQISLEVGFHVIVSIVLEKETNCTTIVAVARWIMMNNFTELFEQDNVANWETRLLSKDFVPVELLFDTSAARASKIVLEIPGRGQDDVE